MNNSDHKTIYKFADHLFRESHGKMIALLSVKFGYQQIDNIVDAVQEAFEVALNEWKYKGIPNNSFAWLIQVSKNKLINKIKRDAVGNQIILQFHTEDLQLDPDEAEDSLIRLLVYFSKINLSDRNKLIIALFYLCGFGYVEISHALMLSIEAIKKIIDRSKSLIKDFAVQYEDYDLKVLQNEMPYLLHVLYLMFNEGFKSSRKNGSIHHDLCFESIRLAILLKNYQQESCELNAIIALFFFHVARFPARMHNDIWISMEHQDRTLWDKNLIAEGFAYLNRIDLKKNKLNKYYLEALIASVHLSAVNYKKTNWQLLSKLYTQLTLLEPTIAVQINKIIVESNYLPIAGLIEKINNFEPDLNEFLKFPFYTTLAHLYEKNKMNQLASTYYLRALLHTKNHFDRDYIQQKIAQIGQSQGII